MSESSLLALTARDRSTKMSVRVVVPKHLSRFLNNRSELDLDALDLKTTLEILSRDYGLDDILLTSDGHLQSFIRLVIDEELLTSRKGADLSLVPVAGKTVEIQSAFAGG
jgi:hypothetical protein